jgi:hypothetical protein
MIFDLWEPLGRSPTNGLVTWGLDFLGLEVAVQGCSLYPVVSFLRESAIFADNKIDGLKFAIANEPIDD